MGRSWSALAVLAWFLAVSSRAGGDEPSVALRAQGVLAEVARAQGLAPIVTSVNPASGLDLWKSLGVLETARRDSVYGALAGGAALTTWTSPGGATRLELLAFASGPRARRYVDALSTIVRLGWGSLEAGCGKEGARAGFRSTVPGLPTATRWTVGRWGRWVAAVRNEARVEDAAAAAAAAQTADALVDAALAGVAASEAAPAEPTIANPWADPATQRDTYEEAVRGVEAACGATFQRRPSFSVPTRTELGAALAADLRATYPSVSEAEVVAGVLPTLLGLYVPATHTLYLVPENLQGAPRAALEVGELAEPVMRVIFAHELVHALDFERFPLGDRRAAVGNDPEAGVLFSTATEGHAHWAARRAALAWGIPEAFATARELQGSTPDLATIQQTADAIENARKMFPYAEGLSFYEAVEAARGTAGVDEVLRHPPTTLEQIERPVLWIDPGKVTSAATAGDEFLRPVFDAVPTGWSVRESRTLQATLRIHLAFLGRAERDAALQGFLAGHGLRAAHGVGGQVDASVMAFATPEDAARFVVALRHVSEAKDKRFASGPLRFEGSTYTEGVGAGAKRPGFRVVRDVVARDARLRTDTSIGRSGRFVVELNLVDLVPDFVPGFQAALEAGLAALAAP